MKRFLSVFLTAILSVALAFGTAACGNNGNTPEETNKIAETETYLVQDGRTDYVAVYPANAETPLIDISVSELTYFFEMATGITLTVKPDNDNDVFWQRSAKYISLGETELLTASGAGKSVDRVALKATGYTIKNAGNSVFLIGGRENGVLNAVYRFLKEQFNFECYAADEIVINTEVRNAKLLSYDNVSEIPDIAFHGTAQNETMLNQIYARRVGMSVQDDWLVELGGAFYHNWFGTIPPATYQMAHPNWFSPSGGQLCLSRDKEGLAAEVLKKIIEVLQRNPSGYAIGFTQMDDGGWCDCATCQQIAKTYGANSATQILFMNYLWDLLEDWLNANMPEKEVYLYMFAYQANTEPPKTDENGNMPEEMKLNEHIYVQFAPIYAAGYQSYGYVNPNASDNSSYNKMFNDWQKITDKIMVWSYSFYYKGSSGIYPYFDFSDMKETFAYLAEHGTNYLFDEDHSGSARNMSDWSRLKIYLRGKLAWDTDADLLAYTDAFFDNYFKAASKTMRQLFDEYCSHYATLIQEHHLRGQGGIIDILETEYWPKGVLDRWMRLIEKAYDDIEYLKDADSALYTKLEARVRLESISLRALCENLYSSCIYVGNGNSLLEDARSFGIGYLG